VHEKISQPARAMPGEICVKDRIAPVIVVGKRRRSCYLPARQGGAGFGLSTVAQQKDRDAAFSRGQSQPPAGHQIQAFGHALDFQKQGAHMRTSQHIIRRRQGIRGIAGSDQDQASRIAAQLEQPIGRYRAILHRLIVGSDPEEGFLACRQHRQQRCEAASAPSLGENFVQGTRTHAATQDSICLWMTCGDRRPVRGQAIARQRMAQFRQLCAFVHGTFYSAPGRSRVNWNRFFGIHSQSAWVLIKLTHI